MLRFCVFLACFVLTSCFDIREEVWVHADGSGRAKFDYHFPEQALLAFGGQDRLEARLRETFGNSENLHLERLAIVEDDGDLHLNLEVGIDSMLEMRELSDSPAFRNLPEASREFAGTFDVRVEGLEVSFRRQVDFREALGFTAFAIGPNQRRDRGVEIIVHLPVAAAEHDADETADDGKTLVWRRSLGEVLDTPLVTSFRAPVPLPPWLLPALAGAAIILAGGAILLWRRFRRRKLLASPAS